MTTITIDQFTRFVAEYVVPRGRILIDKAAAAEMHAAALVLDVAKILPRREFLDDAATTISNMMYVPAEWDLDRKVRTIVHEDVHVAQGRRRGVSAVERMLNAAGHAALTAMLPQLADLLPITRADISISWLEYAALYVGETEERAHFEAEAGAAAEELNAARTGSTRPLATMMGSLCCSYGLDEPTVKFAETILRSRRVEIQEALQAQALGNPAPWRSESAKDAIKILRGISPELVA